MPSVFLPLDDEADEDEADDDHAAEAAVAPVERRVEPGVERGVEG
jgi:hypothetical protein